MRSKPAPLSQKLILTLLFPADAVHDITDLGEQRATNVIRRLRPDFTRFALILVQNAYQVKRIPSAYKPPHHPVLTVKLSLQFDHMAENPSKKLIRGVLASEQLHTQCIDHATHKLSEEAWKLRISV